MTNNDRGGVFDEPVVSRTRLELEKRAKKAAHKIAPHFKLYTEQEVTAEIIAELERLQKIHPDGRWKVIDSRIKELKAKETQL